MSDDTPAKPPPMNLHQLLKAMVEKSASDLLITTGASPLLRVNGRFAPLRAPRLTPAETKQLAYSILTDAQKHEFEETNELDFSFGVKGLARFRGNIYLQRGAVGAVFRAIPMVVPSLESLGVPLVARDLARKPRGLILITGPTGSGKSTTLAAILDGINTEREAHIVTIEDPIEFLHAHKRGVIDQREVGADTQSFKAALRRVLRQSPDVILIGELRDLETMETALTIAETGHLCLATLHTNGAAQTVNRIVDAFPAHQQSQIRAQLSFVLEGVISQTLLPRADNGGRVLACEVMIPNAAIRNLIREDKLHQITTQMQVGQEQSGMQTLNQSLLALVRKGAVAQDTALGHSTDSQELRRMLGA